jgi:hypothetical protein
MRQLVAKIVLLQVIAIFMFLFWQQGVQAYSIEIRASDSPGDVSATSTTTPKAQTTTSSTSTITPIPTPSATFVATETPCRPLSWNLVELPDTSSVFGILEGIEVIGPNDIWAVGSKHDSNYSRYETLVMHWNGSTWTLVPSPNLGERAHLLDVSASGPNNVWAVGVYYPHQGPSQTLIERWNGVEWGLVQGPVISYGRFQAVEVLGENDVWIGGEDRIDVTPRSLITHWNGESWTVSTAPGVGIHALASTGPADVWAVGDTIQHWNGNNWSVLPSPNPGEQALVDIVAIAQDNAWAVGTWYSPSKTSSKADPLPVINHWDGKAWRAVQSPLETNTRFVAITATGPNDLWLVGRGTLGVDELILHWDGQQWYEKFWFDLEGSDLYDIAAAGANDIWAVGLANLGGESRQEVVMRYAPNPVFSDVPYGSTFNIYVQCLACNGIVSGYADGTFRPGNDVSRGQLAKIVSNAARLEFAPGPQMYEDVPEGHTFFTWINRLSLRGHMSGYPCGGEGEPCGPGSRPYFRPYSSVTRGQSAKIISNAAGFVEPISGQSYQDVPPTNTFYEYIERLAVRGLVSGYPCNSSNLNPCTGLPELCQPPDERPVFRPCLNITRGQSSKIVANTFYPSCSIR